MNKEKLSEERWPLLVLRLKEIIEKRGISQEDLASMTGFKQPTISRIFSLKYCPNLRTLQTLADALDCEIEIKE